MSGLLMFSGRIEREQWHEMSLMYQLFFRTANLLLLLYPPLLFIKSMTYSLTIHSFSHSLVYELQSSL